jgi:hypothetical protein
MAQDQKRDEVFDPAADLALLGITGDDSPADRERFAALVNLMATYAHDIWTDETQGIPWVRDDVEEWFGEVANLATTKEREVEATLKAQAQS